jgi:hypothetical protein
MSHILHHNIQTQPRALPYAKWCAISKQYVYPDRYEQFNEMTNPKH